MNPIDENGYEYELNPEKEIETEPYLLESHVETREDALAFIAEYGKIILEEGVVDIVELVDVIKCMSRLAEVGLEKPSVENLD